MSNCCIFVSLLLISGSRLVYGRSEAELKLWFMREAMECSVEHPVSNAEMQMLLDHKVPDSESAKCLLACMFRRFKWIDTKGNYDVGQAETFVEKEHANDVAKIEGSKKLFDLCKKVNENEVTDGEKGCERGALLATCLLDNASQVLNLLSLRCAASNLRF